VPERAEVRDGQPDAPDVREFALVVIERLAENLSRMLLSARTREGEKEEEEGVPFQQSGRGLCDNEHAFWCIIPK
jgi:hypothetical protein